MSKIKERFTGIGPGLFAWKPLLKVGCTARWMWLSCYGGTTAKMCLPGLWSGSMHTMADDARISLNDAYSALSDLVTHKLVTFDEDNRLLRFLQLPDAHDRAHTWQAICGWWTRFRGLPSCGQRDAHVPLIWWMIEQGEVNQKMVDTWRTTFGTVDIPTHLPTFLAPGSSDTGTDVQPSLFGAPKSDPNKINRVNGTPHPSPLGLGRGQGRGQDLLDRGGGSGEEEEGPTSAPRLQLVPDPVAVRQEQRESEQREARASVRELAESLGVPWVAT